MEILDSQEMQQLVRIVEEATRSTKEGVRNFVEPAQGTLSRVTSKRHHIVFGRRGSGKSSLLEKAAEELTLDRRPIAKVDLEAFKGHSYPDVLLSVLIRTLDEFRNWLDTAGVNAASKKTFWNRLFGTTPNRAPFNRANTKIVSDLIKTNIERLKLLLDAADSATLNVTSGRGREVSSEQSTSGKIAVGSVGIEGADRLSQNEKASFEIVESYVRSKTDFLHRHILEYQTIFRQMAELSQGDCFLLLDDLYHIRRSDQANVIDYFHRIAKGNNLWLKVGTIRHRTDWYRHGNPPIGVKLGDDADEINLDLTLEKYSSAKDFLLKILSNFARSVGLDVNDFVNEGAQERLVLASGGVARDFLTIFRRSVDVARERRGNNRGEKIGTEDVNIASGEQYASKQEEFKVDAAGDDDSLNAEFEKIKDFCIESAKTNCFLIDSSLKGGEVERVDELVDLKLLHLVRSRVTVGNALYKGKIFHAFMLDLSQYTGARKRRDFKLVEFWKSEAEEQLRRAGIIYKVSA